MHSDKSLLLAMEAMRAACAGVVSPPGAANLLKLQGHTEQASREEMLARRILALEPARILALEPAPRAADERSAFAAEATRNYFNVTRRDDDTLIHPITQRAWSIWQAGVRWAQQTGEGS